MAGLSHEVVIRQERRQVAVLMPDGSERLGFFHRWCEREDTALVEAPDGTMCRVRAEHIRFLPIGDDVDPRELENVYRENGILKG